MKKALLEYEDYTKDFFSKPPRLEEIDDIFTYPKYFVDIHNKLSQKFYLLKMLKRSVEKRKVVL